MIRMCGERSKRPPPESRGGVEGLGAPLARLLAQIGISTLVERLSRLELAADTLEYRQHFNFRALLALPSSFQPAS